MSWSPAVAQGNQINSYSKALRLETLSGLSVTKLSLYHFCLIYVSENVSITVFLGIPFVYKLDENLKPIESMRFLGDEETVKKAMEAVAAQGKAKK